MPDDEMPSERLPLLHVVHYQIPLDADRVYEPGAFGGRMELLERPALDMDPDRTPFRINISSFLYRLLLNLGAVALEGDCNLTYWPVGSQEHYNKFVEYHTLRQGWDWLSMESTISWKLPGGRNPVCVISKYEGKDRGDRDDWYLHNDAAKKKLRRVFKKGFTLGCNKHDWERFKAQFKKFESLIYPATINTITSLDENLNRGGELESGFGRRLLVP